jgi:hypothetical protein
MKAQQTTNEPKDESGSYLLVRPDLERWGHGGFESHDLSVIQKQDESQRQSRFNRGEWGSVVRRAMMLGDGRFAGSGGALRLNSRWAMGLVLTEGHEQGVGLADATSPHEKRRRKGHVLNKSLALGIIITE